MSVHPPRCRLSGEPLRTVVVDLGATPLANSFLSPEALLEPEVHYPLCVYIGDDSHLVQLPAVTTADSIFSDYAYFSSYSDSWLAHAQRYATAVSDRFDLAKTSQVVEVASNDGYLLQFFKKRGISVLGVDPARNVAAAAEERGIPTRVAFFGHDTALALEREGVAADLMVANNVMAHVPDLHDFLAGFRLLLKPTGTLTIEVPHLLRLLDEVQFDTIYHEHFSYFSLHTAQRALAQHDLVVFDVEELSTHGGSLRIYARPAEDRGRPSEAAVDRLLQIEEEAGLNQLETYREFGRKVRDVKRGLLTFLLEAAADGKSVAAYGAPAKGNTLLNYCGVGPDLIEYTVDRSPHKQGYYLPGSRIPIYGPDKIAETRPDFVLLLPWNLRHEITQQMAHIAEWGGRFVVPIPTLEVLPLEASRATTSPRT